jgi:rare lipoprotein A
MKRLLPALMLLAMMAAAQAQTNDERFPKPSRENPSAVEALKKWLGTKAAVKPAPAAATVSTPAPKPAVKPAVAIVTSAPKPAPQQMPKPTLVSAPATTPTEAPQTAPESNPQSAVLTVPSAEPTTTASAPAVLPVPRAAPPVKKAAGCQRIISAYYWEGKHTASGAPFNPNGMTAAHRTLPFGTKLIVTNPRTGKTVTVTVNDRGPFVKGVSLDLARGAANVIGLRGTGAVCMAKA